jgi:hypothetical protein
MTPDKVELNSTSARRGMINLSAIPATIAIMKFDIGPARATRSIPFLGFLKFRELIGTGLAHPNPATNISIVPNTSR